MDSGEGDGRPIPPPGFAQALVAQAGWTVYEGGHNIFTEPVLVFLKAGQVSEFEVYDHVDRFLAQSLQLPSRPGHAGTPWELSDAAGTSLLQAVPTPRSGLGSFDVYGVAEAQFSIKGRPRELVIERNSEPFGFLTGSGWLGLRSESLTILNHVREPVAELRMVEADAKRSRQTGVLMNIDPGLGGELRRLLLGLPMVVDQIR